jgi:hypothetical protein
MVYQSFQNGPAQDIAPNQALSRAIFNQWLQQQMS